jgi:poly(3-hydroxyalkanoate) synthetase
MKIKNIIFENNLSENSEEIKPFIIKLTEIDLEISEIFGFEHENIRKSHALRLS